MVLGDGTNTMLDTTLMEKKRKIIFKNAHHVHVISFHVHVITFYIHVIKFYVHVIKFYVHVIKQN